MKYLKGGSYIIWTIDITIYHIKTVCLRNNNSQLFLKIKRYFFMIGKIKEKTEPKKPEN